jgi:Tol biopolymer transport system component
LVYPTKSVFISYGYYGGDGGENTDDYYGRFTPELIIYSDGHMLVREGVYQESITFRETFMTPHEMCALREAILETGFLEDHDSLFTQREGGMGAGELRIQAESILYSFYALDVPYLIEPLANGAELIRNYRPSRPLQPYTPVYLALWMEEEAVNEVEAPLLWPSDLPSLAELWSMRGQVSFSDRVVLEGEAVDAIFNLFSRQLSRKVFQENGAIYSLIARPLLPHETPRGIGYYPSLPIDYAPVLTCQEEPDLISPTTPTVTPTLSASTSRLAGQGRILFVAGNYSQQEIYVMDADGSNRMRLTNNLFADSEPVWSPDGQQIAFVSERLDGRQIFVMATDGSNVRQLTHSPYDSYSPAWSPDGSQIAFVSEPEGVWQEAAIHVMNADGSDLQRLTYTTNRALSPIWSPDGRKILFAKELYYVYYDNFVLTILHLNEPGLREKQLPIGIWPRGNMAWSPDSSQIAVALSPTISEAEIRIINLDGSEVNSFDLRPLEFPGSLGWSASGQYILFGARDATDRERISWLSGDDYFGNSGIYALDLTSGEIIQITFTEQDERSPAWWP